jgi:predicted PurR-regulated permease PerM
MIRDEAVEGSAHLRRILKWIILFGSIGIVAYLCAVILLPFLTVIGWSVVFALISSPMHQWLLRKTGRASVAASITSVVLVLVLVLPLLFVGGVAITQLRALEPSLSGRFQLQQPLPEPAATVSAWLAAHVGLDATAFEDWVKQHGGELVRGAGQFTFAFAAGAAGVVISLVFTIITTFLMLRDGDGFVTVIPDLLPIERRRSEALLLRIRDAVYASVYGVVVIAVIQGVLCGVMFGLLRIPSAALWGTVATVVSVLPVVGASAVWGPGALYLALIGAWPRAILLALWGIVVVSGSGHVLSPRLVGRRAQQTELAMFFALLGGFRAFGGLGIVLGPVLFAVATAVVDVMREPNPSAPRLAQEPRSQPI